MSRIASLCDWLLRSPIIWGTLAWLFFDMAVRQAGGEWLNSYFTETWVHTVTTAVFFVGMAALVIRGLGMMGQYGVINRPLIDPIRSGGQPIEDAALLTEQLDRQPDWLQKTYVVRRLHSVLEHVTKSQSADRIESQLETLEEADYDRMSAGYAMVRVITGVVPLLGFLGTVIGITQAIGQLSINPEQLEASLGGVIAGLSDAFSTTALALALSIVLVFTKLIVERFEDNLLVQTKRRVTQEIIGRFEQFGTATDPQVASISRMCDQVVRAVEVMAAQQADVWRSTIDETHERWALATSTAGEQLTSAVTSGLRKSLEGHAEGLTAGVEQQLAALNAGITQQAEAFAATGAAQAKVLADTAAAQTNALTNTAATQSRAMTDAVQASVSVLREVVERHGAQLETGSKELLGNLRSGLERMAELLVEALQRHGETLTNAEKELASENRRHLGEVEAALGEAMVVSADRQEKLIGRSEDLLQSMQESVAESAGVTIAHQKQLVKQGEVLLRVVEATGQVQALEDTLNRNLEALGRGQNLEETLLSLSAAIQLLSARTSRVVDPPANPAATNQAA